MNPTRTDLELPSTTANRTVVSYNDRLQRELYEIMEALCHVLERNHESIAALPADTNAYRTLVSRTHSSRAPATLDHVIIDHEEVLMFGHTLELDESLYMPYFPRTEEEAAQLAAKEAKSANRAPEDNEGHDHLTGGLPADPIWGHDLKAFVAACFETFEYDAPYPSKDKPHEFASDHGFWLMQHTLEKIDNATFLSDVTFREHLSNVVDGIKRSHAHPEDITAIHNANMNLAMYVYLNCATRSHEKVSRGFREYNYGNVLCCPARDLLRMDPAANDRTARVVMDDDPFDLPLHAKKLSSDQRHYLRGILTDGLVQCGVSNELLDPNRPQGLLMRESFYDAQGRVLFHELFRTILLGVQGSINDLVEIKKVLMTAKHNMRDKPLESDKIHELNALLASALRSVVIFFKMLEVLRSEFTMVLNSHVAWICGIVVEKDDGWFLRYRQNVDRPNGLYDEFAAFVKVPDSGNRGKFILSSLQWINLVCQQEAAMKVLRRPSRWMDPRSKVNTTSIHIMNSRPLYLRVSPAAYRNTMANLDDWITEIGFTKEEKAHLLKHLVDKNILTQAEVEGRGFFKGCVHATAAIFCLSYLQRRRKTIEISKRDYAKLEVAALEDHLAPYLPDRAITDMVPDRYCLVVGHNRPFCAGCRVMLHRAMFSRVHPEDFVHNRIVTEQWAEFDMPPWTTRDSIGTVISEADNEAFKRISQLLVEAARDRGEALSGEE